MFYLKRIINHIGLLLEVFQSLLWIIRQLLILRTMLHLKYFLLTKSIFFIPHRQYLTILHDAYLTIRLKLLRRGNDSKNNYLFCFCFFFFFKPLITISALFVFFYKSVFRTDNVVLSQRLTQRKVLLNW